MRPDTASATRFHSGVFIVPQRERGVCESAAYQSEQLLRKFGRRDVIRCRKTLAAKLAPVLPPFLGGSEKLRTIEKAVRAVEYGDERRSVGTMRDMDVAARPPHEITRSSRASFVVFSIGSSSLFRRNPSAAKASATRRRRSTEVRAGSQTCRVGSLKPRMIVVFLSIRRNRHGLRQGS
jgi:hypothetical protein